MQSRPTNAEFDEFFDEFDLINFPNFSIPDQPHYWATNNRTSGQRPYQASNRIDFDMLPIFVIPGLIYSDHNQAIDSSSNYASSSLPASYQQISSVIHEPLSKKPEPGLNDAQKQMIEDKLKLIFADISAKLTPSQAIKMLNTILSDALITNEMKVEEEKNVFFSSNQIREILAHVCPQNDKTVPDVTKEVASYIHELIKKEIKRYQNKAASTMQFWYRNKRDESAPQIPDEIICPLTGQIFNDPVEIPNKPNNIVVERDAIVKWVTQEKQKNQNPFTRETLTLNMLKPAVSALKKVEDFFEKNKDAPFMHLSKYARYKKEEVKPEIATREPAQPVPPTRDDLLAMLGAMGGSISEDDHYSGNLSTPPANSHFPLPIQNIINQSPLYIYYYNYYLDRYYAQAEGHSASHIQENATSTAPLTTASLTHNRVSVFNRPENNVTRTHIILSDLPNTDSASQEGSPRRRSP